MKKTKKKPMTHAAFKKKVWKVFSEYIRLRDSINGVGLCCTCPSVLTIPSGKAHAGHFIHGSTKKTYFHEKNVHLQCRSCNFYKDGAADTYALFLINKYGDGVIQEVHQINKDDSSTWKKKELEAILEKYKIKLKEIKENPPSSPFDEITEQNSRMFYD